VQLLLHEQVERAAIDHSMQDRDSTQEAQPDHTSLEWGQIVLAQAARERAMDACVFP
jgi:hypothetical protein